MKFVKKKKKRKSDDRNALPHTSPPKKFKDEKESLAVVGHHLLRLPSDRLGEINGSTVAE